ncbi:MFS transporter [Nonomuraea sp. NPDC052265]|uniref:MFS transporter n=1 Tax=Nonomuraea sp. NPDC052265 TaxID=3364374 RepID=UPI0037C9591A
MTKAINSKDTEHDVVVVGAGAAGLSAALLLGRARRKVVVVDAGAPRNAPAAHMHGYLSRDGLPPSTLLELGRAEIARYGVRLVRGARGGGRARLLRTAGGRAGARGRLPLGIYLLSFGLFSMGSAEFLLAGVLPAVAEDLRITLSSAGGLISAFAAGVVIGGPPLAIMTLRWPRRTTLVVAQAAFAACVAIGILTDSYPVLLVTRFLCGLAYAGFWAVVAFTVAGAVLTLVALPATSGHGQAGVRSELRTMRRPQLWIVYAVTLLSTAAYMISYNYLAAFLTEVTGVPGVWVPAILTLFGVGAFAGLSVGGRIADRLPTHALLAGALGIAACSVLLAVLGRHVPAVVPLVLLLGVAGFVLNPAVYGRVFAIASGAPTLAGATTVSAFQLGISLVPVSAAAALDAGAGLTAVPWIGAGLAVITIVPILLDRLLSRR